MIVLILLMSSSSTSIHSIVQLLHGRHIPNVFELSLFCYKLLQGIFRFFIIFCWCMQRTDGWLHHYHHPTPQSVNNNIYDSFSFLSLHVFSFSFFFRSPIQFSYAGCQFFVPEIPLFRLSWYPCDSSINRSAKQCHSHFFLHNIRLWNDTEENNDREKWTDILI